MRINLTFNQNQQGFWNEIILNCKLLWNLILKSNNIEFKGWEKFRRLSIASVFLLVKKTETTSHVNAKPSGLFNQLLTFINIWPIHQWIFSLITLVIMYWVIGTWYNKKLQRQGGWISWQARLIMIFIDLMINLALGIYYMGARDTFMGEIMLRCPIAISPLIFLIEFLAFVWYYKKYVLIKKDKNSS